MSCIPLFYQCEIWQMLPASSVSDLWLLLIRLSGKFSKMPPSSLLSLVDKIKNACWFFIIGSSASRWGFLPLCVDQFCLPSLDWYLTLLLSVTLLCVSSLLCLLGFPWNISPIRRLSWIPFCLVCTWSVINLLLLSVCVCARARVCVQVLKISGLRHWWCVITRSYGFRSSPLPRGSMI